MAFLQDIAVKIRVHYVSGEIKEVKFDQAGAIRLALINSRTSGVANTSYVEEDEEEEYTLITEDDRFVSLDDNQQFFITSNKRYALLFAKQHAKLINKSYVWQSESLGRHRKLLKCMIICRIELIPILLASPLAAFNSLAVNATTVTQTTTQNTAQNVPQISNVPSLNQGVRACVLGSGVTAGGVAATSVGSGIAAGVKACLTGTNNASPIYNAPINNTMVNNTVTRPVCIPAVPTVTAQQANRLLTYNACTGNTILDSTTGECVSCTANGSNSYANSTHTACTPCGNAVCGAFNFCDGPTYATNVPCAVNGTTGYRYPDCAQGGNACQGLCQGSCGASEIFGYGCTLGTNGQYGCHLTQGWLLAIWIISLILLVVGLIVLFVWLAKRNKVTSITNNMTPEDVVDSNTSLYLKESISEEVTQNPITGAQSVSYSQTVNGVSVPVAVPVIAPPIIPFVPPSSSITYQVQQPQSLLQQQPLQQPSSLLQQGGYQQNPNGNYYYQQPQQLVIPFTAVPPSHPTISNNNYTPSTVPINYASSSNPPVLPLPIKPY